MATYDNIPSIAVIYEGTISAFNNITDKSAYYNSVVFITGNASSTIVEDKKQAIWVSSENGANAHFLNMADVDTVAGQLSFVKGIKVGDTTYPTVAGGAILTLAGTDISIDVDAENGTVTFDASGIKAIAEGAASAAGAANDAIAALKGDDTGSIREIAEGVADDVKDDLIGTYDDNWQSETIRGVINDLHATNVLLFGTGASIPATGRKLSTDVLPDVIMGQLKFGGTIGGTNNAAMHKDQVIKISPSSKFSKIYEGNTTVSSSTFAPSDYEGWYFIVAKQTGTADNISGSFIWPAGTSSSTIGNIYEVGDWFLSTGEAWEKIDNTDSVSRVAGLAGDITTALLAQNLSTYDKNSNADPLAKASDITIKDIDIKAKLDGTDKSYFAEILDDTSKTDTIRANMFTMHTISTDKAKTANGFADARDVYDFIKARLSIRVVK